MTFQSPLVPAIARPQGATTWREHVTGVAHHCTVWVQQHSFERKIEFSLIYNYCDTWTEDQGDPPGWHRSRHRNISEEFEETLIKDNRTFDQLPLHVGCLFWKACNRLILQQDLNERPCLNHFNPHPCHSLSSHLVYFFQC